MTAKADTNPLREALEQAREAIASVAPYTFGGAEVERSDGSGTAYQYPIRDELLAKIDAALASEPVAGTEREALITAELEELASNFEGAGGMWHGASIATALRERIKNHHFYEGTALPPQGRGVHDICPYCDTEMNGDLNCPACGRERLCLCCTAEWRPIETAPKDRYILAIRAEWWTPVNGDHRWVFSRIRETNWLAGSECFDFGDEKQPTHWMPKPEAPTLSRADRSATHEGA